MKYKALVEKLDWKGRVTKSVRSCSDGFKPNLDPILEKFVKTGKLDLSNVGKPDGYYSDILKKVAPAKADHTFSEYEPGLRLCAGEYVDGIGIQYVVKAGRALPAKWMERDSDIMEGC